MDYRKYLQGKAIKNCPAGIAVKEKDINDMLFPFQRDLVMWALKCGKCAIFADCGLGKTFIQLEWARLVGDVLIVAPLAVSNQTIREGKRLGITVNPCRSSSDVKSGINITNYEMLHHFTPGQFGGLVLDESSILKSYSGKYRQELTEFAESIGYRLCCTATPAPNDLIEIINHSEFLGIMTGKEVISMFFIQDGNTTHKWRLKGHAEDDFWKWMATWSVAMRMPEDLGYENDGFILPELVIHEHIVDAPEPEDTLFPVHAQTLNERRQARKASIDNRVNQCADIVLANPSESWLVWCGLNAESEKVSDAINGTEVKGSDSREYKENSMIGFSSGGVKRLVTKPTIAGFGMNWQHCSNVIFLGLSDSYEQFYQAVRRCWRFGQKNKVNVHIVISEEEGEVRANIQRKENESKRMFENIVQHMKGAQMGQVKQDEMKYAEDLAEGENYKLYLGDSIEVLKGLEDNSVGLSVFSPPFPGMYVYTNSKRDVGNCRDFKELITHFSFIIPDLLRVSMPGRSCAIHLTQGVAFKWIDGYSGLKDFRGAVIQAMEDGGWIYYGEVCIDKDPQVKAIRTKDQGLLFKTLATDSSKLHMALADYVLQFKKPGDNPSPIKAGISDKYENPGGWITSEEWIEWAAPVWYRQSKHYPGGIRETDVLNVICAREDKDEKHLCPLQLGVIERAIKLWSNPHDLILDPFAGIGSTGYQAIMLNRKFVGIELKRSYYEVALGNLKKAISDRAEEALF